MFYFCDKYYKIIYPYYFSFTGPNPILSLITFWTNIGPYDVWYGYLCYFDKFDRNGMYSSTSTTKELSVSFLCVLESLTLYKSK